MSWLVQEQLPPALLSFTFSFRSPKHPEDVSGVCTRGLARVHAHTHTHTVEKGELRPRLFHQDQPPLSSYIRMFRDTVQKSLLFS